MSGGHGHPDFNVNSCMWCRVGEKHWPLVFMKLYLLSSGPTLCPPHTCRACGPRYTDKTLAPMETEEVEFFNQALQTVIRDLEDKRC